MLPAVVLPVLLLLPVVLPVLLVLLVVVVVLLVDITRSSTGSTTAVQLYEYSCLYRTAVPVLLFPLGGSAAVFS